MQRSVREASRASSPTATRLTHHHASGDEERHAILVRGTGPTRFSLMCGHGPFPKQAVPGSLGAFSTPRLSNRMLPVSLSSGRNDLQPKKEERRRRKTKISAFRQECGLEAYARLMHTKG